MPIWDDVIPKDELERFAAGGMGVSRVGIGDRPALVIVDMSYGFVDSAFPLGDGEVGWPAVAAIQRLRAAARERGLPVFYSTSIFKESALERGLWKRTPEVDRALADPKAYEIVAELAPRAGEPVVVKTAPSAFFGTDLLRMLVMSNVDTLIVAGMVTSGCVYATAVDGFSNGFRVVIPEECAADRSRIGHKVALFNFHMKYGDVLPLDEVLASLGTPGVHAYLEPGAFVDSDAPSVREFARRVVGDATDDVAKAMRLYYAVRDEIAYAPYRDFRSPDTYRASAVLRDGSGFCVGKAALLAAVARASGIPARPGFADVRNHLCTPRLRALIGGTDVFYYHGYVELYLDGRWVKATPAFDRALGDRFGVHALDFDGRSDSLFQPYDRAGRRHMEYLCDRGPARDVPVEDIMRTFAAAYPGLVAAGATAETAFRAEAEQALGD
jgi:nicotinamidase-related amidase